VKVKNKTFIFKGYFTCAFQFNTTFSSYIHNAVFPAGRLLYLNSDLDKHSASDMKVIVVYFSSLDLVIIIE